jgi:hypothetical protein
MLLFSCNIEINELACHEVLYRVTNSDSVNNDVNRIYYAHDWVECRGFMNIVLICQVALKGCYFLEKDGDSLLFQEGLCSYASLSQLAGDRHLN